jgi:hypothetical protein
VPRGEFCTRLAGVWQKRWGAFFTYPGMKISTVRVSQSHARVGPQYMFAIHSVLTVQQVSKAYRRCFMSSSLVYFKVKSSMPGRKVSGRLSCRQRLAVCLQGE